MATVLAISTTTGEAFALAELPGGGWLMSPPLDQAQRADVQRGILAHEHIEIDGECVDEWPAGLTIAYRDEG